MTYYLNKKNDLFYEYQNSDYFVDKSLLIKECNELIKTCDRFVCVTRLCL